MTQASKSEAENERAAIYAKKLRDGAKRACLRMTQEFQFPGKQTFTAGGAWALHWAVLGLGRGALCEHELLPAGKHKRAAYRLTPLGAEVQRYLAARGDHLPSLAAREQEKDV